MGVKWVLPHPPGENSLYSPDIPHWVWFLSKNIIKIIKISTLKHKHDRLLVPSGRSLLSQAFVCWPWEGVILNLFIFFSYGHEQKALSCNLVLKSLFRWFKLSIVPIYIGGQWGHLSEDGLVASPLPTGYTECQKITANLYSIWLSIDFLYT